MQINKTARDLNDSMNNFYFIMAVYNSLQKKALKM